MAATKRYEKNSHPSHVNDFEVAKCDCKFIDLFGVDFDSPLFESHFIFFKFKSDLRSFELNKKWIIIYLEK